MGEYADMAIDDMLAYDEWMLQHPEDVEPGDWSPFTGAAMGSRRDRRRNRGPRMQSCKFCGKYPLFFHEERSHVWILAEWGDDNRPARHVCKLKKKLKNVGL